MLGSRSRRQSALGRVALAALVCVSVGACASSETVDEPSLAAADAPGAQDAQDAQGAQDEAAAQDEWSEGGQVSTQVVDSSAAEPDAQEEPAQQAVHDAVTDRRGEPFPEPKWAQPADEEEESAEPGALAIDGSLTSRYIGRWSGGDHDNDIYSLLSATVGDPDKDPYSGYILGRLSKDLDGSAGEDSPYFSLEDTYDNSLNGRLYEAYVDFHDVGLDLLRVGRQSLYDTPAYARFDGASLVTETGGGDRHQFGAYVGRTVHEYESSPAGDAVAGAYVSNSMWKGGKTRIDYMHLEDDQQLGDENDDLWAAQVQQLFGRELLLHGGYQLLENAPRQFDARATWTPTDSGWMVQGSYYELMQSEGSLAEELDPFFDTLQEYQPYSLSRLLVSKYFDSGYSLEGGADLRRVDDAEDEGDFNRDYDRYHLTGTVEDFLLERLTLALTGDYWASNGTDSNSMGFDLTREFSEIFRGSIGSYYQLYKNDFLLDEERDDVRTYYVALRYKPEKRLTWGFGFEHEDSDVGDFNTLTARSTWNF